VEVSPDLTDRLFTGVPTAGPLPVPQAAGSFDLGTQQAPFSSSRLVPVDARLEFPYRASGKLFFHDQFSNKDFVCSASLIGLRLVLTAGHCVHKGSEGANGYFQRFLFVPAYHQGQVPYQAWNYAFVITTGPWSTSNGNVPNKADFAILELEDRRIGSEVRSIGQVTGYYGYRTNGLMPNHVKILGYPVGFDNGQVMHQVDAGSHKAAGESTVLYGSDMTGGSSGGGWIENFGIQAAGQTGGLNPTPNRIVGVTSYGFISPQPKVQGSSILNQDFLTILNAVCSHRSGNCP
jgi:V8-like Glu-specific endopeptidase